MLLTRIREAAKQYSMSPSTFYRWHCCGKFPKLFAKIGKVLFIDEAELRRMVIASKIKEGETRS